MQQFTVPQFIDVEDKIIGPLTTRQFLIMLFCAAIIGLSYKIFDFSLFLTVSVVSFSICGLIAFFKVNGMAMHYFILNFLQTKKRPGLRVWNNAYGKNATEGDEIQPIASEILSAPPKRISTSRLSELALIVDTRGAFRGENNNKQI
ncbi:MAG: PrgI family protein [bacterium]